MPAVFRFLWLVVDFRGFVNITIENVSKSMTQRDKIDKVRFPNPEVFMNVPVSNLTSVKPARIGYRLRIVIFLINMELYPSRKDTITPPMKIPGFLLVKATIGKMAMYVKTDIPSVCRRLVSKTAMLKPEIPYNVPTISVTV